MNTRKLLISVLFGFLIFTQAVSQLQQPHRFEKEQKYSDEDFTIISLKTEGLALVREENKFKSGKQFWEVILLDTTLHEKNTLELELEVGNELTGYEYSPGYVHLLFIRNETKGEMGLLSIDLTTQDKQFYEIKPELNFMLTQFCRTGDNFAFGGYVNHEPAVLLYSPSNNNIKIVPGFFSKNIELIDMRANQNQTFNTLTIDRSDNHQKKIIFRTYDSSGKQILEDLSSIDEDIVLLTGISGTLEREDLIMIGTWGKANSKQASGFYTLAINPFTDQKINRIHFGSLQHYLDYLKPKKAAKVKLRSANAIEMGKIPEFADYVIPFKIVEHARGFLLLAELYNPSSNTNQYPSNLPYNSYPYSPSNPSAYSPYPRSPLRRPMTYGNNVQNSEEIKTVESVVLAFDGEGKPLWDYSLPLTGIKMQSLEQICDFTLVENTIHFLYKNESELKVKTINLDDQEVTERTEKIQLTHPEDEIRSESEQIGSVKHWFGKNFYVWGYQSIRNKVNPERTRQTFYINKVVVH